MSDQLECIYLRLPVWNEELGIFVLMSGDNSVDAYRIAAVGAVQYNLYCIGEEKVYKIHCRSITEEEELYILLKNTPMDCIGLMLKAQTL